MTTSVLLVSDGLVHPSLLARFWLRQTLASVPGYRFRRTPSLEVLPRLPPGSFRAIVLYVHHHTLSPETLKHLEDSLQAGGGLLALHSASASFKEESGYHRILGGRFVDHGPVETFLVQPARPRDEVFGKIPSFSVRDELYRHEYDEANRVHFYTTVGEAREPVVWTRRQGRGRVCYCALGHTVRVMRQRQVQQIIQRGLGWVCEGEAA